MRKNVFCLVVFLFCALLSVFETIGSFTPTPFAPTLFETLQITGKILKEKKLYDFPRCFNFQAKDTSLQEHAANQSKFALCCHIVTSSGLELCASMANEVGR